MASIVEFSNPEDARKTKDELADKPFMGRSVFIREVRCPLTLRDSTYIQDREETARFGAPPIPGKIGMATGESRHFLGQHVPNPANKNLFINNVSHKSRLASRSDPLVAAASLLAGP